MLYEFHVLKNYPATNLNRDDTGAPKTCVFGGCTRGRISSQCLKRSWRTSDIFREEIGASNLGVRTRHLPDCVISLLKEDGLEETVLESLKLKLAGVLEGSDKDAKKDITPQIAFYSAEDIRAVADAVKALLAEKEAKKITPKDIVTALNKAETRPITLDIALFGRMVTSDSFRDVDAAMQVAHAVSTNRIVLESDFYTAMDDMLSGDSMESSGAGMMGDIDYNSSCYYLYANLDTDALLKNLDYSEDPEEIVRAALPALIRTMAFSNPSGKQNTFAGHVLPAAILVECKEKKIPVSYVNAFAEPVNDKKLVSESIRKLAEECGMMQEHFGIPVEKRFWFCLDKYPQEAPADSVVCHTLNELTDGVAATLK